MTIQTKDNSPVVLDRCDQSPGQVWILYKSGFINPNSGKCLSVAGSYSTKIVIDNCPDKSQPNSIWEYSDRSSIYNCIGSKSEILACKATEQWNIWTSGSINHETLLNEYTDGNPNEEWCADFVSYIYNISGSPFINGNNAPWDENDANQLSDMGFSYHDLNSGYLPSPGDVAFFNYPGGHAEIVISGCKHPTFIYGDSRNIDPATGNGQMESNTTTSVDGLGQLAYYLSPNLLTNRIFVNIRLMSDSIIDVKNLTKIYGEHKVVKNISFSVARGEVFGFLGPNGAGKSTTIKMLTTLLKPTNGTIKLDGTNVIEEKNEARFSFGIVFQDPSLDDELTAYENMELHGVLYHLPKADRIKRSEELMKLVELWDRKDSLVKTFSGGMKRRLEIARGLLHHPKVLFLDEPTLGLDTQTRNLLWDYVEKLNKTEGMTIFFTTHYLEEAENVADRIAVIDDGKIIANGTVKQLLALTKTKDLESAYLRLTGKQIREEEVDPNEAFRSRVRSRRMR